MLAREGGAEMAVDSDKLAEQLRPHLIDRDAGRVHLSRLTGSEQEADLTVPPNCNGFGRIRHFKRFAGSDWPNDPLPIDPAAHALGTPPVDELSAQVFQLNGCNMRCWYCFVPDNLLRAHRDRGAWFTPRELLDAYLREPDRPAVIDLSGGNPDLTPEWPLWMAREIERRGLEREVYLWSDDSLSTGYLWTALSSRDIEALACYPNCGRVGCFKGYSAESFSFNTRVAGARFDRQFELMRRLVGAGFDTYGYVTLTTASTASLSRDMPVFVDRLQQIHENLPLRIVPLKIVSFTPTERRLNEARRQGMMLQHDAVDAWQAELARRYPAAALAAPIWSVRL